MKIGKFRITVEPHASKAIETTSEFVPQLTFQCNICEAMNSHAIDKIERDERSCTSCSSTLRFRSVIHLLSCHLFGKSLTLREFPVRKSIKGIGMTDWDRYACVLKAKLDYTNTFYHQKPTLDIVNPPTALIGSLDFIMTSDVMEHVPPPIDVGFSNFAKLLKPGGALILTVPFTQEAETQEHFPDLYQFKVSRNRGEMGLQNITRDGREEIFDDLVFHGGDGSTLEMRLFCEDALVKHLKSAGFENVFIHREPFFKFGIYSREPWSVPISAKAV